MADYINAHIDMGCAGALAMPNTKPPVSKVRGENNDKNWSITGYTQLLENSGADQFEHLIVPLYLTKETTAAMIEEGAKSGILKSCKYYPPHSTTNADFGHAFDHYFTNDVFKAMEEYGVILNIHGEQHGLNGADYFDKDSNAEDVFYRTKMPKLAKEFPNLKIVCEHITTKTATDFVSSSSKNVSATITPQHLLFTVSNLLQGFKYHLYCLPLIKFEEDRKALLNAVTSQNNSKFFAGTDSAPHTTKATDCGCAAGCFTGGIAPQLYAQAFNLCEENFETFKSFLCLNGPNFYGFKPSEENFIIEKKPSTVSILETKAGAVTPLSLGIGMDTLDWTIRLV